MINFKRLKSVLHKYNLNWAFQIIEDTLILKIGLIESNHLLLLHFQSLTHEGSTKSNWKLKINLVIYRQGDYSMEAIQRPQVHCDFQV